MSKAWRAGWPVLLLVSALAGCAGERPAGAGLDVAAAAPPEAPTGPARVLACDGLHAVAIWPLNDALRLELPARDLRLPQVPAASGEHYADDAVDLHIKGDSARYRGPGDAEARACRVHAVSDPWQQAALRGVTFRAVGQEPGWIVELVAERWLRVLADYGAVRLAFAPPVPVQEDGRTWYEARAGKHRVSLVSAPQSCTDVMSGEVYPLTVTLVLDGREYRGCGRNLP